MVHYLSICIPPSEHNWYEVRDLKYELSYITLNGGKLGKMNEVHWLYDFSNLNLL